MAWEGYLNVAFLAKKMPEVWIISRFEMTKIPKIFTRNIFAQKIAKQRASFTRNTIFLC
jgi:hypothetical protein